MSSGQAPWVKVGVPVRRKASGFLHSRGEIVAVDGGLGVRCPTIQTVKRDDDIASSWEPCEGQALPVATEPVMLDGGPCSNPSPVDGVKSLNALLEQALCFHVGWPDSATTRHTLRQLWERLDAEIGERVRRLPDLLARMREAGMDVSEAADAMSHVHGQSPLPPSTMERILVRLDALDAALKPIAQMSFDSEGRVVMTPDGIQMDGVVHEERVIYARTHGLQRALDARCDVCKSPEGQKCWLTFQVGVEPRLVKEAPTLTKRNVDMSRVVPFHLARTRAATRDGVADPAELPCPTCGVVRWGRCRAVEGLDNLPTNEASQPSTTPTEPTLPPKRYVQAHLARDEAAAASGWMDSYTAPCSHCGAARWEGCTAVGGEPDYGEPVPRVNVRLWNAEGTAHFMSIAWPERTGCVARGLFEVCTALVPPVPGVLRPGLRPVARTWESLDDEERDYWHTLVKGYLDGTLVERTVGAVEWAALGAMVRVFGLQRKA